MCYLGETHLTFDVVARVIEEASTVGKSQEV